MALSKCSGKNVFLEGSRPFDEAQIGSSNESGASVSLYLRCDRGVENDARQAKTYTAQHLL